MPLGASLSRVLTEYPLARQAELTDHPLASHIAHNLRDELAGLVDDSYKVTGSPGRGNWAETPWVAVFDPLVTETAQRGFYVVYLFRGDGGAVYLSLNQGTTEVYDLYGGGAYLDELRRGAATYVGLLASSETAGFATGTLDLGGEGRLTRGYEAGNVYAAEYRPEDLADDERLEDDLGRLMTLYSVLVPARDALVGDSDPEAVEAAIAAGVEAQKERWHKRTERNPRLARDAKRYHGSTCQVCSFNFEDTYGELGAGYIEAHHLTLFAELEGRPTQLDPRTDFAVVCPNCHRMLHRRTPPVPPDELRELISRTTQ